MSLAVLHKKNISSTSIHLEIYIILIAILLLIVVFYTYLFFTPVVSYLLYYFILFSKTKYISGHGFLNEFY